MARSSRYGTTGTRGPKPYRPFRKSAHGGGQHGAAASRAGRLKGGHVTAPPTPPVRKVAHGGGEHGAAAQRVGRLNKGHVTLDYKAQLRNNARNARLRREVSEQNRRTYGRIRSPESDSGGGGIFHDIGHAAAAVAAAGPAIDKAIERTVPGLGSVHHAAVTPIAGIPDTSGLDLARGKGFDKKFEIAPLDVALAALPAAKLARLARVGRVGRAAGGAASKATRPLSTAERANLEDTLRGRSPAARTREGYVRPREPKRPSRLRRVKARVDNRPRPVRRVKARARAEVSERAPQPVKDAYKKTADTSKRVRGSKPGQVTKKVTTPVRAPGKVLRKHPVVTTAGVVEGPGVVGAVSAKDAKKLTAPVQGYGEALLHPGKTGPTTYHALAGGMVGLARLAGGAAQSGGRVVSEAAHEAGVPGARGYSAKSIYQPTKEQLELQKDFLVGKGKQPGYLDVMASGDPEKIKKAVEGQYGASMLLPLIGAGRAHAVRRNRALAHPEEGIVAEGIPLPRTRKHAKEDAPRKHIPVPLGKKIVTRRKRKGTSRGTAVTRQTAATTSQAPADRLDKAMGNQGRRKRIPEEEQAAAWVLAKSGGNRPEHFETTRAARNGGVRNVSADKAALTHHDISDKALQSEGARRGAQVLREEQPDIHRSDVKVNETQFVDAAYETRNLAESERVRHPHDVEGWSKRPKNGWRENYAPHQEKLARNKQIVEDQLNKLSDWRVATGRDKPVYVASEDASIPWHSNTKSKITPWGTMGRVSHDMTHESEAILNKTGLEDISHARMQLHSVVEPRVKIALNEGAADFIEQHGAVFPLLKKDGTVRTRGATEGKVLSDSEMQTWIRENPKEAENFIFFDGQNGKAAVVQNGKLQVMEGYMDEAMSESVREGWIRLAAEKRAGMKKGAGWVGIERTVGEEFLSQHGKIGEEWYQKIGQGLLPTQRASSKLLLGYSPSWLIAQPIAEGLQGLAAVGPYQMYKGLKAYQKLSPLEKRKFDARIGATLGVGSVYSALTDVREGRKFRGDVDNISDFAQSIRAQAVKTRPGRLLEGVVSTRYANKIDRTKGLAIRRAVAAGHLEREYNSLVGSLHKAMHEQDLLDTQMRGLSPEGRLKYMANNAKAARRVQGYLDDVMGNWSALTTNERALSGVVIFYPFVRMSLEWTLLSYPARHPLKAAALQFLGMQNAQMAQRILGGKPSFITDWASATMRGGQRITAGSNSITEGLASIADNPRSAIGGLNPLLSGIASAIGAYDPSTGRSRLREGEIPSLADVGRSLAGTVMGLPSIARVLDQNKLPGPLEGVTGQNFIRKVSGKEDSTASKLYRKIDENNHLLHQLVPFGPQEASTVREKAEIGRLLARQYGAQGGGKSFDADASLARADHDLAAGRSTQAVEEYAKVYDAIIARNRMDNLLETKGLTEETTAEKIKALAQKYHVPLDQAEALVYGQSATTPLPATKKSIADRAIKAGIPLGRIRRVRRKRARELMAYNNSVEDGRRRRARHNR